MDPVIRASRLAPGRTVLAVPGQTNIGTAAASAVIAPSGEAGSGVGTGLDPAALRRSIEQELHEQWRWREREALAREHEAARREGKELGLAQGLAEAQAASQAAALEAERILQREHAERRERAESVLQSLQQAHADAMAATQGEIGLLTFEAVCRIAGSQALSREFILGIVEAVCRVAGASSGATLRLHPRDLQLLDADAEQFRLAGGVSLKLMADDSVRLGGCLVDTEAGQFDGSLATQLERLHALLCPDAARKGEEIGA